MGAASSTVTNAQDSRGAKPTRNEMPHPAVLPLPPELKKGSPSNRGGLRRYAKEKLTVVELEKAAGVGLGLMLQRAVFTGTFTVLAVPSGSLAFGILAAGDVIIEVNGVTPESCEHVAELIFKAATLQLTTLARSKPAPFTIHPAPTRLIAQQSTHEGQACYQRRWSHSQPCHH